jgi:hypothetical protein
VAAFGLDVAFVAGAESDALVSSGRARNPSPGAEAAALGVTEAVLEAIGTCRSVTALMSHSGSVASMGFFHNLIVHAL